MNEEVIKAHENKALFYKDTSGKIWFFGIYSNNFEDRQKEIISWDAHLEYAQWIKESGYQPPIVLYHQPNLPDIVHLALYRAYEKGLITAQTYNEKINSIYKNFTIAHTKSIIPVNGFMLVIGEVPEEKQALAAKMMEDSDWGMSHGFLALQVDDNIINRYRSFELTALASNRAANALTVSLMIGEEGMGELKGLTDEDRQKLDELIGEGAGEKIEEATQKAQELLSGVLASKQTEPAMEEDNEEKQEEEKNPVEEKSNDPYVQFRDRLVKELGFEELQAGWKVLVDTVQALSAKLETSIAETKAALEETKTALKVSEDELIARQYYHWTPPVSKKETETDAELVARLKESAKEGLVAKEGATADDKNPLVTGFWNFLAK